MAMSVEEAMVPGATWSAWPLIIENGYHGEAGGRDNESKVIRGGRSDRWGEV
jgi:hypothetical protein